MPTKPTRYPNQVWRPALLLAVLLGSIALPLHAASTPVDEGQTGAWYMLFWRAPFEAREDGSQFGLQGDIQYRNWDQIGDLEQLLLRGGLTWSPKKSPLLLTLGYAHITSGEFGTSESKRYESRIYQELLWPHRLFDRLHVSHRFRTEQRWVEGQDLRTRFRYALFANIPLNKADLGPGVVYIATYNELFVNGEEGIGRGRTVDHYDRNRLYGGLGYQFRNGARAQLGFMRQSGDTVQKNQMQFSLHHTFGG